MKNFIILIGAFLVPRSFMVAQQINIEELHHTFKAKPVRINGAVSASTVLYQGNGAYGRSPFNWFLQGNVNVNLYGKINLPFSFNLTNAGGTYNYPVLPTRLSVHPTYKWIAAHIGDVTMTLSPYSLNGYLFRGFGADLTPAGPIKFSFMVGRLQRAVNYDSMNRIVQPSYYRFGYGAHIIYDKRNYRAGISIFNARDSRNSLTYQPDSLQIFPGKNLVVDYELAVHPLKNMEWSTEYGTSLLTRDVRDTTASTHQNYVSVLSKPNGSSAVYHALRTQVNYNFHKSTVGVGYEKIDPGYQTYGTYYFNNDLENITVNLGQNMLHDKATIGVNAGFQRDNLNSAKSGTTHRFVGAINLSYAPNAKIQSSFSYSSFSTYMNIRPQFAYINQQSPLQNFDTLNFTQVSQNANANIAINTRKNSVRNETLNVNMSFQNASDEQGGTVANGNGSQFYNLASSYAILFLKNSLNVVFAYNISYNTIARNDYLTHGPTVSAMMRFLKNKLSAGTSASYNTSRQSATNQNNVFNFRANVAYTIHKSHSINFSLINQYRTTAQKSATNDLTTTLSYGYHF